MKPSKDVISLLLPLSRVNAVKRKVHDEEDDGDEHGGATLQVQAQVVEQEGRLGTALAQREISVQLHVISI